MKQPINYFVIVPAAGIGLRMQSNVPKQYLPLKGKTILEYSLHTLLNYPLFKKCVLVLHKEDKYWPLLHLNHPKLILVTGGSERYQSVFNGLLALESYVQQEDWIVVHDAVRPFLKTSDIDQLIKEIGDHPLGGLLGCPLKNTIKRVDDEQRVLETLDRRTLWHALTPQMFRYHWLFKALHSAIAKQHCITDEAHAIELLGQHPKIIKGRSDNIKITDPCDLVRY
jgi:2-C-methyl-D-erythritol 4-phosphate cytidylyltransferase